MFVFNISSLKNINLLRYIVIFGCGVCADGSSIDASFKIDDGLVSSVGLLIDGVLSGTFSEGLVCDGGGSAIDCGIGNVLSGNVGFVVGFIK